MSYTSPRWKDYTFAVTVNKLPISEDDIGSYFSLIKAIQERADVNGIIKIDGHDDPQEILISYRGDDKFYMELNFPMEDFQWDHPLFLSNNELSFEEVASVLWSILVEGVETISIPLIMNGFHDVTEDVVSDTRYR